MVIGLLDQPQLISPLVPAGVTELTSSKARKCRKCPIFWCSMLLWHRSYFCLLKLQIIGSACTEKLPKEAAGGKDGAELWLTHRGGGCVYQAECSWHAPLFAQKQYKSCWNRKLTRHNRSLWCKISSEKYEAHIDC